MEEKYMVNDALEGVKASLTTYQGIITETENTNLRQTFQELRNNDEAFQYELFKIAQVKGYYAPSEEASQMQITKIREELN